MEEYLESELSGQKYSDWVPGGQHQDVSLV